MDKHSKTLSILFHLLLDLAALVALAPHGHSSASANADLGAIAYACPSTHDIRLISPDGAHVVYEYQATGDWLDQYLDLDCG